MYALIFSHTLTLIVGFIAGIAIASFFSWQSIWLNIQTFLKKPFTLFKSQQASNKDTQSSFEKNSNASFRIEAAKLLHEVAICDAPINSQERDAFWGHFLKNFMPESNTEREALREAFSNGKLEGRNLSERIANFYWQYASRKTELITLARITIELIIVDGAKNGSEAHVLDTIARSFGIHPKELFRMEEQVLQAYYERMGYRSNKKAQGANSSSKQSSSNRAKQKRKRNAKASHSSASSIFTKHYSALGCTAASTRTELKQAYRKLVKIHHPDHEGKIERFREIQDAYEALKKAGKL